MLSRGRVKVTGRGAGAWSRTPGLRDQCYGPLLHRCSQLGMEPRRAGSQPSQASLPPPRADPFRARSWLNVS